MKQDMTEMRVSTDRPTTAAAEEVYSRYGPRAYALAVRLLDDKRDAEDATREVLFRAVLRPDTTPAGLDGPTWLYRATVNAVRGCRQRRAAGPGRPGESGAGRTAVRPARPTRDGARDRIEAAIRQLPDCYRDPLVLSDVEGCSVEEVSSLLALSPTVVRSLLHRARLRLLGAVRAHLDAGAQPIPDSGL